MNAENKHLQKMNDEEATLLECVNNATVQMKKSGYIPTIFKKMIQDKGVVQAIEELMTGDNAGEVQSGFKKLISLGRQDLTMEKIMQDERWSDLFTSRALEVAKWRLKIYAEES